MKNEEEQKAIEKYMKEIFKQHYDVFEDVTKHIAIFGYITDNQIELIVKRSIEKHKMENKNGK